jgi:hypothetical protein
MQILTFLFSQITSESRKKSLNSELPRVALCIQKFLDWVDNEIYAYNNKHSLRRTQNVMAAKLTRLTLKIAIKLPIGSRYLYYLQFSLQAASPETFGYTLVSGTGA